MRHSRDPGPNQLELALEFGMTPTETAKQEPPMWELLRQRGRILGPELAALLWYTNLDLLKLCACGTVLHFAEITTRWDDQKSGWRTSDVADAYAKGKNSPTGPSASLDRYDPDIHVNEHATIQVQQLPRGFFGGGPPVRYTPAQYLATDAVRLFHHGRNDPSCRYRDLILSLADRGLRLAS